MLVTAAFSIWNLHHGLRTGRTWARGFSEFDQVTPSVRFVEDLGMDEELVEFVMGLEEQFRLKISDDDASKVPTLGTMISYIYERTHPLAA